MTARRRVLLLTLVLSTVALGVAGVALTALYRTAFESQRERLHDTAVSRARLIEAMAGSGPDGGAGLSGGSWQATLSQLRAAQAEAPGLGATGEFMMGYADGDSIRFLLPARNAPGGGPPAIALDGVRAEPMRRALAGASGTVVGPDYRGVTVLAAHEPLRDLPAGVVAKLDLAEIRAPFIRAAFLALGSAFLLVLVGVVATTRIGGSMADELVELADLKRLADDRLRLVVEGAGLGFWEVDFEQGAWHYSDQLRERLGYEPGALDPTLEQWSSLLHPADREAAEAHKDAFASGAVDRYETRYRLRAADGSWHWIHSLGHPVGETHTHAVGVHRDVTAEHAVMETLQRSEERLSGIVEALPGSLVTVLDRDLRYIYVAGEALDLLGITRDQLLGRYVGALLDEDEARRTERHYRSVLQGATVDYELQLDDRTFLVRASPILGADGEVARVLGLATDITDRKERERLLHQQREQLDRIVESIPRALVLVLDEELRVEFIGGEAMATGDVDPADRVGTPALDWVDPDTRGSLEPLFRQALSGVQVHFRGEFPGRFRGSNDRVPLEISAGPLRGPEGRIRGALVLALDVSEEWEARKALEATQERLRLALNAGQHGIFDLDVSTGEIEVSDLYASMLGYDAEGFHDTLDRWMARLHPDDRERGLARAEEFLHGTREDYHSEFRQRTADGDWIWVRSVARAVARDADGRPTRVMGTHTDVTHEKEAERSRELLSTAVEQSTSLVLITDVDGVIEYVNPEFERVTGYDASETVGRDTGFLMSGHHEPAFYRDMWARLRRGESFEGEFVNRKKDGSEYRQRTLISPILGDDGKIHNYVSIARDVTMERALEEQLRQAQKMEAVGQLTGGIAHDFNNVLTGILSNVQLALDALPEDASDLREELWEIRKAGRHGAGLVRKLMAFSRDKHLDRTPTTVSGFLEEIRTFLARTLSEDIAVVLDDGSDGAAVQVDPGAMHQILLNLGTNARDAMPDGGTLTLRARTDREEGRLLLDVTDDGMGMDAQVAARIFEPFFTTKAEGTGLGLSMVYALTERQEGTVAVESEPGRGTTFHLSFPLCEEAPTGEDVQEQAPRPETAQGNETILVVEDEPSVRRAARLILERVGYTVQVAEDGVEGLEVLEREAGRIDLVLTDVVMPRMSGPELFRAATRRGDHPPFVFTSGYADRDLETELGEASGSRFLRKPWDGRELLGMIQQVLREERG